MPDTPPTDDVRPRLHVVLYQPEIPQNTGNIGRTCVAVGAKLWLVQPLAFRMDDARLRRAGLDYWDQLDWQIVADWEQLQAQPQLAEAGNWRLFSKRGQRCLFDVRVAPGDVLVFGSETQGLPDGLLQARPEQSVRIPMCGPVRSLNLASAVAVGVYACRTGLS